MSLAAVGCNDSPTRQAEKNVMEQIAQAQRLCGRAQGMLRDTLFLVNDMPAPLFEIVPPESDGGPPSMNVTFPAESSQLNPQAIEALAKARKALVAAVAESAAPEPALVLANESLARIRMLQGACEDHKADALRRKIARTVAEIQGDIPVIRAHLNVQIQVDRLAGGAREEVAPQIDKILAEIKAETEALKVKVTAAQTAKDGLDAQRAKLMADATRLAAELSKLGQDHATATAPKTKIILLKEIELKEVQAEKVTLRTKVAEAGIADATALLARLDLAAKAAGIRQTMVEALKQEHKTSADSRGTTRTMSTNLTGAAAEAVVKMLQGVERDWAKLGMTELAAQVCYDDAAALLKKAQRLAGADHKGASLPASEGQARMASARIDLAPLDQHRTNVALATSMRALWRDISRLKPKAPGAAPTTRPNDPDKVLTAIEGFPSSGKKDGKPVAVTAADKKKAAAKKYSQARRAFESAVAKGDAKRLWLDHGLLAYSIYMYAICANDSPSLVNAQKAIQIALQGKRESPDVMNLLAVERKLTFGARALVTVKEAGAGGEMILTDGPANGSFFKELIDGRTTKDLSGTVYVYDQDIGGYKAGEVRLMISPGVYMKPPEGFELTIPADMTVRGVSYKGGTKVKVGSGGLMPG